MIIRDKVLNILYLCRDGILFKLSKSITFKTKIFLLIINKCNHSIKKMKFS